MEENPELKKATIKIQAGGTFDTLGIVVDREKTYPDPSKLGETVKKHGAVRIVLERDSGKNSQLSLVKEDFSKAMQELAIQQLK